MHHWPSERLLFVPSDLALTTANRGLTIDAIGGAYYGAYYTVADGDGQTKATGEAGVDVGGDPGPAAQRPILSTPA